VDPCEMQKKLSRWATDDPTNRFVDLYSLLCNEIWLRVAAHATLSNKGSETAGSDNMTKSNFLGDYDGHIACLRACFENHAGLRANRRRISRIIASFSRVALVWSLRSSSLRKRRCRPNQPSVRSTIPHHGLTTNPWTCGGGLMLSTRQAPSVAHQVASGSPL
jgi:hypothetical protein